MTAALTVGAIKAALADLPDDAQVFVSVVSPNVGSEDMAVTAAWASQQIPWSHNPCDGPKSHEGQRCPTVWGFEIHAEPYDYEDAEQADAAVSS